MEAIKLGSWLLGRNGNAEWRATQQFCDEMRIAAGRCTIVIGSLTSLAPFILAYVQRSAEIKASRINCGLSSLLLSTTDLPIFAVMDTMESKDS